MTPRRESDDGRNSAGFTLLEMLVVLAIVGALAVIAAPALLSDRRHNITSTETTLASNLRLLRAEAIRRDAVAAVEISADHYVLQPDGFAVAIPKATTLQFEPAAGVLSSVDDVLEFFPDGSSTGGVISVHQDRSVIDLVIRSFDGTIVRHDP